MFKKRTYIIDKIQNEAVFVGFAVLSINVRILKAIVYICIEVKI